MSDNDDLQQAARSARLSSREAAITLLISGDSAVLGQKMRAALLLKGYDSYSAGLADLDKEYRKSGGEKGIPIGTGWPLIYGRDKTLSSVRRFLQFLQISPSKLARLTPERAAHIIRSRGGTRGPKRQ
jgi:hypothetical protein